MRYRSIISLPQMPLAITLTRNSPGPTRRSRTAWYSCQINPNPRLGWIIPSGYGPPGWILLRHSFLPTIRITLPDPQVVEHRPVSRPPATPCTRAQSPGWRRPSDELKYLEFRLALGVVRHDQHAIQPIGAVYHRVAQGQARKPEIAD
jgi:hypothetical protein